MNTRNGNVFRDDEMVILSHYDKKQGTWVETEYPKVGGRLRLAHEDNEQLSITTEVIQYDGNVAVVKASAKTRKGEFTGLGMASIERDAKIAPAILELAETRSIARCLRFSGYGVEYCGAEEVSHLPRNGKDDEPSEERPRQQSKNGGNGRGNGNGNGNGNGSGNGGGDGRITNKQLNYIVQLGKGLEMDSKALDEEAVSAFGVKLAHLTSRNASVFIDTLKTKDPVPF